MKNRLFIFLLSFLSVCYINPSSYTIFPVRHNLIQLKMPYPLMNQYEKNELSWELAQLMIAYTKIKKIPGYYLSKKLNHYFIREELTPWNRFGNSELKTISNLFHFENILLSKLEYKNGSYNLTTALYSKERNYVYGKIHTNGKNLLDAVEENFSIRHPEYSFLYNFQNTNKRNFLFIIDSSGKAYFESKDLFSKIYRLSAKQSAYCTLNEKRNLELKNFQSHETLIAHLKKLSFSGDQLTSQDWMKLEQCSKKLISQNNIQYDTIITTSGGFSHSSLRHSISHFISSLSRKRKVFLFGTSNMDHESKEFARSLGRRNGNVFFYENPEWEKILSSKGSSLYVFRKNNRIYYSDSMEYANKEYLEIPGRFQKRDCSLNCIFREIYGTETQPTGKKGYLSEDFIRFIHNSRENNNQIYLKDNHSQKIHLTVESDNLVFRLSLPYSSFLSMKQKNPNWKDHYLYFFLSFQGNNISDLQLNHPSFGEIIYDQWYSPRLLNISIKDYFLHPENYRNKSFHSGNFYIIRAKILKIKIDDHSTNTDWSY